MRVLIVDDQHPLLIAYKRVVRSAGVPIEEIATATSPRDAEEIFHTNPGIVFVLSDYDMPEGTGWELFQNIREELEARGGRFMAMSGHCAEVRIDQFAQHGVGLHEKPVDLDVLIKNVREVLQIDD